jgi:2-polyprenyl-3-methyl-5-hydroxy-6-metoxy-1,4-benzoquinol methylase
MPDDALMTASLAYRKNEAAILSGKVPEKYLRLLPFIPGNKILEIGSAEGVLALLLAQHGKEVVAIERQQGRHETAQALRDAWDTRGVRFICGDIRDHYEQLFSVDTLVAVRMIYYLRGDLDAVFAEVAKKVPTVVLCGNINRANRWRQGIIDPNSNADDYYASEEGMTDLLTRHGYRIVDFNDEGDEIVVGCR